MRRHVSRIALLALASSFYLMAADTERAPKGDDIGKFVGKEIIGRLGGSSGVVGTISDIHVAETINQVGKTIEQCSGKVGPELAKCLAQGGAAGILEKGLGVDLMSHVRKAKEIYNNNIAPLHKQAMGFFKGAFNKAKSLAYSALGKKDLFDTANEGSKFLGDLAMLQWSQMNIPSFPQVEKDAGQFRENLRAALKEWHEAILSHGIPASREERINELKAMGFEIRANETNMTVISLAEEGKPVSYWRKSPWGWLPCSDNGHNVVDEGGNAVPITQINQAISEGRVSPLIWIKGDDQHMEPISRDNYQLLVENNLNDFMPKPQ